MYSDSDMQRDALEEWTGTLERLWDAVGKTPEAKRLMIYARELGMVPLGLLEAAVSRAIRNNGQYQNVPSIGAVWAAVRAELEARRIYVSEGGDIREAITTWAEQSWERAVIRFQPSPAPIPVELAQVEA